MYHFTVATQHFERPAKDFQKAHDEWDALQELLGEFQERVNSSLKPGIESVVSVHKGKVQQARINCESMDEKSQA